MNNEKILKQAIEKAKNNGFETNWILPKGDAIYSVIFNHDFAKAFWGENYTRMGILEWMDKEKPERIMLANWQYHLQQMVLEDNPLLYISKFL